MCGIAGFFAPASVITDADALAGRMIDRLAHRGPDDRGVWTDPAQGIALAHRRLSIIDLSPAGHQPMQSALGRYVVSYNGEIFNFEELRRDLPPPPAGYRGHSDTETLLRAIEIWGLAATLQRLIGFFALALWDRETACLTLVRDRLGIKPLYWCQFQGQLIFGSELGALTAHPACPRAIDRHALAAYLRTAYVPAPLSILRGVQKLMPGGRLDIGGDGQVRLSQFWDLRDAIRAGGAARQRELSPGEMAELTEQWHAKLRDAVKRRMVADVPLGAFLSGGVDSSTILALMQEGHPSRVKSYSIGFHEAGFDEAPFARQVAAYLGSDHHEFYVGAEDALAIVPELASLYDEPFADSSQIPTALICRLARQQVTVALSGDGGDELFGGYNRYLLVERWWPKLAPMPPELRRIAAAALAFPSPNHWDYLLQPFLPRGMGQIGDKLHKLAQVMGARDADSLYLRLISQWADPASLLLQGEEPPRLPAHLPDGLGGMARMQACDALTYLPDDILTKVDRASMAVALEVRVPFLDHRLVEDSWHLPTAAKLQGGRGKKLLREILYRHVPRELIERPKMGFGVPIDRWLRGPLKDWASRLLEPSLLAAQGYLRPAPIGRAWDEHQSGRRNHQYALWTILMFQAWLERHPELR